MSCQFLMKKVYSFENVLDVMNVKIVSRRVFVTGMALPWLGFGFGCMTAKLCRRPLEDVIAIAIETGIQNTGVSIFILWFTLDQPAGDLTGKL